MITHWKVKILTTVKSLSPQGLKYEKFKEKWNKRYRKEKKPSVDNIQRLIHEDWKSLNIISTEGVFYFLSRLNFF